jgi:signal transduction histidine kinase
VAGRERRGHERVDVRLETQSEQPAVQADEELLERAVENVLRNAVAAASEGGGHVRVSVERVAAGALEISVEDDGPGLPPGHTGEIRPFHSTKPGGLGLGLPLARKIMRLHGGDLALRPGRQGGVAVTLSLPEVPTPERLVT